MNTKRKTRAVVGGLGVLTALALALPASAHCDSGRSACRTSQAAARCVAECTVEDCAISGRHLHDGVTYCGAHHEDGVCTAECYAPAATADVSSQYGHHGGHRHGHC